jgi:hypothetical protein
MNGGRSQRASELRFVIEGKLEQAVAAMEFQFLANVLAMIFYRFGADFKLVGDFLAGVVFGDQL